MHSLKARMRKNSPTGAVRRGGLFARGLTSPNLQPNQPAPSRKSAMFARAEASKTAFMAA